MLGFWLAWSYVFLILNSSRDHGCVMERENFTLWRQLEMSSPLLIAISFFVFCLFWFRIFVLGGWFLFFVFFLQFRKAKCTMHNDIQPNLQSIPLTNLSHLYLFILVYDSPRLTRLSVRLALKLCVGVWWAQQKRHK